MVNEESVKLAIQLKHNAMQSQLITHGSNGCDV